MLVRWKYSHRGRQSILVFLCVYQFRELVGKNNESGNERLLEGLHLLEWVDHVRRLGQRESYVRLYQFREQLDAPEFPGVRELPGCILQR